MTLPTGICHLSRTTRIVLIAAIVLFLLLAICQPVTAARDVRVAIHEIRPSLYTDEQGKPAGIFVDLIQDIAAREGWNLIYVHGTFQESLDRLATGQVDLVMALTDTPEREKIYDFNRVAAVSSWTQVYASPKAEFNTILDLDRKHIALLKGDVNAIAFREYATKFSINPTYTEMDTINEVFEQTSLGKADAAVASHVAGQNYGQRYGLTETPVMFYPNPLDFAVPKGTNQDLLLAIDQYLVLEKSNPSSYYSQTMQKWFGEKAGWVIPPYFWWGFGVISCLVVIFVILSVVLRREVRRQTAELSRRNEELVSEVTSRTRAEKDLVRKNEELQAAYEQLRSAEAEMRANYQDLRRSEESLILARKKLNLLNTLTFQEIQNGIFSLSGFVELANGEGCDNTTRTYLGKSMAILRSLEHSLNFAKKYEDIGISHPLWQSVKFDLSNAISRLDFSKISRTVNLEGLEIYADPLLENVFYTLMENIIRHATGVTSVTISCKTHPDGVTIYFEDNGPGIPASEKENIFNRSMIGRGESGLFLSKEILSITGITLRETGTEGVGARFEILVPNDAYRFAEKESA